MVQFDNQYRQVKVKVVYYGPALGGKTTCLQHIHGVVDPERRTRLYSLNTASDRTLFFDLLSLDLGRIRGYGLAIQLYTVPGQVQYNATRRAVLSGADGVVFVADSQVGQRQANIQSLENLWENLAANGLDSSAIPLVLQYNKRDLEPALPLDDLEATLNPRRVTAVPSVATTGEGVMQAFATVAEQTLVAVADRLGVGSHPVAVGRLQEQVRVALEPYVRGDGEEPIEGDQVVVTRPQAAAGPDEALAADKLVTEAVRANLATTSLTARLDVLRRQLERKVRVLSAVAEFGQSAAVERDPSAVLRLLIQTAVRQLRVQAAAVLVVPGSGEMREVMVHGIRRDPLLATTDEVGESLAVTLAGGRSARLITVDGEADASGDGYLESALRAGGFLSAAVVPLSTQERLVGMLTCYRDRTKPTLDEEDLQLAQLLGSTAAMAYGSAVAWRRLEELNRDLEAQVAGRTQELRASLAEVERLAGELAETNRVISDAYRQLTEVDQVKNELITRVSRELKNPVASLQTAAKILGQYQHGPPEKAARFIEVIRDEASKLAEVVDSVVQAAVLAGAQEVPIRQVVAAEELFRRAVAPLREMAQARSIRLQARIQSGLDRLECDPQTLEAGLRAIIKNAIEFSHDGGAVLVEVRRQARGDRWWVSLRVKDDGIGIPEQEQPHVFETFWQGGNVLAGKRRGIGLGLAIAKRVVENHGGTVRLRSRVAEGTEVTVELPQEPTAAMG
jgi:signal transduction histidine kinase/signal recognition particle receptor subunit beta